MGNKNIRALGLLLILLSVMLTGCAGRADEPLPQQPPRDMVLEQTFVEQLRAMNPSAVPLFQEATTALDAGDYQKAQLLLEQVIKLAPEFSSAYRRLGSLESMVNDNLIRAEELLRKAVALEPNGYNRAELALALLRKDTPSDYQVAFALASQSVQENPNDYYANYVLVIAAATVNNLDITRKTADHLVEIAPWHPIGHYFVGLLAVEDRHWEKAQSELLYSQRLGMDPGVIQDALASGISRNVSIIRFLRWGGLALAGWLAGLGILYLLGSILSKSTLRSLSKMEPTIGAQLQPSERTIRSVYRAVIVILSLYYYISLPFVILALVFVVGGVFYLFFLLGTIPIKLAILLGFLLLASLFAIFRSLLVRRKEVLIGRPLTRSEAPELWKLVDDVAHKLNTRPADSILVTPFAGISVNEKGGMVKLTRKARQRNLLLGMGALCGLDQGQFAAILAHEYGHFYNRDTAGGDLAYKVYSNLDQLALGLVRTGSHQFYNPVWWFVLAYQRIFLRVSQGASRLQEVLADRFAVMAYGRENFIEGLKNIVRRTLAFQMQANYEINKMLETHQPIHNIYQIPMQNDLQGELQEKLDKELNRKTSPYDSHPSTMERIALVDRMRVPYVLDQGNSSPVAALFPNFEELQQDLTSKLIQSLPA